MDASRMLIVGGVFFLAGTVKGVTGLGLPTVAMSLLGLFLPPVQAAALLVLPSLATNLAQCRGPHALALARRLWPGWVALVVATIVAPGLGGGVSGGWARRCPGGILLAYGLWGWWRPSLPTLSTRNAWRGGLLSAVVGALTGGVTAATAVFVLPWVPYLQALDLRRDALIQALGLSFTIATLALAVRLQAGAPLWPASPAGWATVGLGLAGAFAGLWAGSAWRASLASPAFQRALFTAFMLIGLANLLR